MSETKETRAIIRILKEFQKLDRTITVNAALAFMIMVEEDERGGYQKTLEERIGLKNPTVSRIVSTFLERKNQNEAGYGFIESRKGIENRKFSTLRLTKKGQKFADVVKQALNSSAD